MARLISVTLDVQMNKFINDQVSHGKFRSPAEVVEAGVRLLQHQVEIEEGLVASRPYNFDNFLKDHYRRHAL